MISLLRRWYVFAGAALFTLGLILWKWTLYTTPTDVASATADFSVSQYILGDARQKTVSDEVVYIATADTYFKGADPTTLNFEHPPLGKYLLGLSLALFGNALWVNGLAFFATLVAIGITLKNWQLPVPFVFLGMALFSLSGAFVPHQFSNVMLDGLYIAWYTIFLALFFWPKENWVKYFWLGIITGCLVSTKYSIPLVALLVGVPLLLNFFRRKMTLIQLGLVGSLAAVVYLASYSMYFLAGHTLIDWLRFEWYRLHWWFGERTMPSWLIVDSLFRGSYPAWFQANPDERVVMGGWTPLYPLEFVLSLMSGMWLYLKNHRRHENGILLLVSVGIFVACGVGKSSDLKYLIIAMPAWYLLITQMVYYLGRSSRVTPTSPVDE